MADIASPPLRWVASRTLWVLLVLPALGLLVQALLPPRWRGSSRAAGVATLGLTLAAVLVEAVAFRRAWPSDLFQHLATGPRVGALLSDLDLRCDELAVGACALAVGAALVAASRWSRRSELAWLHAAVLGGFIVFLADDLSLLAMGASVCVGALAWLDGARRQGAMGGTTLRGAVGLAALVCGMAALRGGGGDVAPDAAPAFRVLTMASAGDATSGAAGARLSMDFPAGAAVTLDDARTPFARAPFAERALPPGTSVLRVRPAGVLAESTVGLGSVQGASLLLMPARPGLSLRVMGDLRAASESGASPEGEDVWSGSALRAVMFALLVAASAWGAWSPVAADRAKAAVACTTALLVAPFLLVRSCQALPLGADTAILLSAGGALLFAATVWRALGFVGEERWVAFAAGAPGPLTALALGRGGAEAGAEVMFGGAALSAGVLFYYAETKVASTARSRPVAEESLLLRWTAQGGELVESMDRWVVAAAVGGFALAARVFAWVVAWQDEHAMMAPGNAAARRLARVAAGVEALFGAPVGRMTWWLLGAAALVALLRGIWPGAI